MFLFLWLVVSTGVMNWHLKAKGPMELEINCVGKCDIETVGGDEITLKVQSPDSLKSLFGIKEEKGKITCGILSEMKKDVELPEGLKEFFKLFSDSVYLKVGIPKKVRFVGVEVNSGTSKINMELKKYNIMNLWINVGAGNVNVSFLKKNKFKGGGIQVNAGGGTVVLIKPENFRADTLSIFAGASNITLDFYKRPYIVPTHMYIESAVSSYTILLPDNLKCFAKKEGVLNLKNMEACKNSENPDLIIHLESALSSVNVIRKK